MRILVTGGGGLIGRHVVDRLVVNGNDVVSFERSAQDAPSGLEPATSIVPGDLADVEQVNATMADGIEGVIHLAAVPAPVGHTAVELQRANALPTMAVLEAAGTAGVSNVVLASSISVLGMAWADELMSPVYVPIDEAHPLWPTEGYALSKEHDEASARMAARRWGMSVACLRFPFTTTADALEARLHDNTPEDLAAGMAKELWAYLDVRDAAAACELALLAAVDGRLSGAVVVNVVADDLLPAEPLSDLMARWHPGSQLVDPSAATTYTTERAQELLGFRARHLVRRGHPEVNGHER